MTANRWGWLGAHRAARAVASGMVLNSSATAEPDRISSGDLGLRDASMSGWFNPDTRELCPGFKICREDVVVDVGCGNGGNARFCASLGASVTLVDILPEALERAEKLAKLEPGSVTAIQSDGNPLPLSDSFASRVISTEVLEHVDDPPTFIRELVRIGRPGCVYLLSVPDAVGEEIQKKVAPDFYFQKPNHIRIFQRDEFTKLARDAGLIVDQQAYYGFYWALYWSMFWPLRVSGHDPRHPVLDNWIKTWTAVLDSPAGPRIQELMNQVMPKSQVIIAHKPASHEA